MDTKASKLEELEILQKKIKSLWAGYREEMKREVEKLMEPWVNEAVSLGLDGVGFEGYTPYFNDGDTCVYSKHGSIAIFKGEEITLDDIPEGATNEDDIRDFAFRWEAYVESMDDELALGLYGDHVCVYFTKKGVQVEECPEHD